MNQMQSWLRFVTLRFERYWVCVWSGPIHHLISFDSVVQRQDYLQYFSQPCWITCWNEHVGWTFVHSKAPLFIVQQCPFAPILIGFPCHCIVHIMAKEPMCTFPSIIGLAILTDLLSNSHWPTGHARCETLPRFAGLGSSWSRPWEAVVSAWSTEVLAGEAVGKKGRTVSTCVPLNASLDRSDSSTICSRDRTCWKVHCCPLQSPSEVAQSRLDTSLSCNQPNHHPWYNSVSSVLS